ncbi:MAG: hypothetical protein ACE5IR_16200 [bacterium]
MAETLYHGPATVQLSDATNGPLLVGYMENCQITREQNFLTGSDGNEIPLTDFYEFNAALVQTDTSQFTALKARIRIPQQIEVIPEFDLGVKFVLFDTFVKVVLKRGQKEGEPHVIELKGQTGKQVQEIVTTKTGMVIE